MADALLNQATIPLAASRLANGGHAGFKLKEALRRIENWTIAIIKRSQTALPEDRAGAHLR